LIDQRFAPVQQLVAIMILDPYEEGRTSPYFIAL
jgi:hypothetical protein